ncbi:hypothetical protein RB619_11100 [Flavobacterium sp. LHD-80]|uniref:hypothetical protein n=1 Tax=Flavobacterium sp. LHD-80 TaxID=3071411 RepID=UPI0027E1B5AA|nr:hypothetical protein [Flavobacterium sp. LHD-80]MDQ6471190.1 hypothetical protein [Flavobacterium sp. LHD-80]
MEKFEIDLKWGSYFFLINTATSILITLLMSLVDIGSLQYLSNILIPIFIIQLLYFSIKVLKENKRYNLSKGFRKILVFIRFLVFYFMLSSCVNGISNVYFPCFPSLFPYRDKDISEFLIDENSNEDYVVTLNDFLFMLKRKLSRAYI